MSLLQSRTSGPRVLVSVAGLIRPSYGSIGKIILAETQSYSSWCPLINFDVCGLFDMVFE